ncbi:MAG: hypothetical protein ACFFAS_19760 [Promethearchaeota archaeon]
MGQYGLLPIDQDTMRWLESTIKERNIQLLRVKTSLVLDKTTPFLKEEKNFRNLSRNLLEEAY